MSKHTPGPWKRYPENSRLVIDGNGDFIAVVVTRTFQEGPPLARGLSKLGEVSEANSKLITASPKMLAALKGLDCVCLYGIGEHGLSVHSEECQAVKEAIKEAEGED